MTFFRFSAIGGDYAPVGMIKKSPQVHRKPGGEAILSNATILATLEGKMQRRLPDFMDTERGMYSFLLLSERVCCYIKQKCRPHRIQCYPVQIDALPRTHVTARYYYVLAQPGLKVTRDEEDLVRRIPVPQTWNGDMLFDVDDGNMGWPALYCSEEFIDAYIDQKWRGCLFNPMDLPGGPYGGHWNGVDTASKNWRDTMYPPRIDEGQIDGLVEHLRSDDVDIWWPAYSALGTAGQAAAVKLIPELARGSASYRRRVGGVLNVLASRGVKLPPGVEAEASRIVLEKRQ